MEEYLRNTDLQWIIERGLEVASSTILDLGNHILAGVFQTPAEEYEQILEKLHEKHVLSLCRSDKSFSGLVGLATEAVIGSSCL